MGTLSIGGKPQATSLFLRLAMFLGLFLSFGVATAFAGALTVTNTNPAPVVGVNVANFTISIDIAAAADFTNGETITITLPANFPEVALGDANDTKLGATVAVAGLAGTGCNGAGNIDCGVAGRVLTITFADVANIDGAATALANGHDVVVTLTTAADTATTAAISYVANWTMTDADHLHGTSDGVYAVGGVTPITTTVGTLTGTNVEPSSLIASTTTTNTITFTTTAPIPNLGKIKITYPSGWNVAPVAATTAGSLSGLDGTWTATVSGQVVTLTQTGGGASAAGVKSLTLSGVETTSTTGASGTYTILTEIAAGDDVQTATASADTILGGSNAQDRPDLDAVTDVEITKNDDGEVVITWTDPSGDDSTHVDILRGKNGNAVDGTAYAKVLIGAETYTDTDVEVGDTLKYILRTSKGVNYGPLTDEFSLTVTAGAGAIVVSEEEVDEDAAEEIAEEEAAVEEDADAEAEVTGSGSVEFTDLANHWAAERIVVMAEEGIIKGDPNGEFRPDDSLNRAEAAALLNRVLGLGEPAAPAEKPFSDVEVSTWYAGYVSSLKGLELVNGNPDGTYKPAANINRAEFLHLALNVYYHLADADVKAMIDGVRAETTNPFVDVTGDAYYVSSVRVAHQMEFVEGAECEGGRCFSPAADITRAEATKILYEMFFAVEAEVVEEVPAS